MRPVGSDREVPVDVRVVAASHRKLDDLVEAGTFRADLLGRLAGFRVELPGLAARKEEILALYERFVGDAPPLTSAAAELLLRHTWPLNVRELKHLAERVRLVSRGAERVDVDALPDELRQAPEAGGEEATPSKAQLEALLAEHGGNVAQVARALGSHRQQLYRWLKKYTLDPASFRKD